MPETTPGITLGSFPRRAAHPVAVVNGEPGPPWRGLCVEENAVTDVTRLLEAAAAGDSQAADALLPLVYTSLKQIARRRMTEERPGHTLQATALVHECYLRLFGTSAGQFAGRAQFFHAAAESMRRILIEHARARGRAKRGGSGRRVPINVLDLAEAPEPESILAFDEAIERLEKELPAAASVVRLRFYAGLTVEETAQALDISSRTVNREWTFAKAWLFRELGYCQP